ncbi:unnamed protein product [Acanthoscelides obtectus]|uniref:Uncharacterized protein n=1 Tax=Acanthoscelides obtectus TaxID=200917 RepID=A0A9P0Q730_ACAOB|nr:unnamed protein product [Acanthoscelides obtectus]CAK1659534.1 hypothetical protein AOBTE_LOCUS21512 [Acanthoscelides obtectus]
MALLVQALNRMKVLTEGNVFEVTRTFCCALRECLKCKDNTISYKPYQSTEVGHFFKWTTRKESYFDKYQKQKSMTKTIKQKLIMPLNEMIFEFEGSIINFLKHKGRSLHQYNQISKKKESLMPNEVMIHVDFSENYSLKHAEETQAFHFGGSRQQICLHTVVIYFKSNGIVHSKSFCTLSQSLKHDVSAIWAHLQPILSYISEVHVADTLIFVSDSPATQYRNKTMFYFLANKLHHLYPKIKVCSWNYWESGHGKGAPDGVGGVTKRTADRLVAEGKDISSYEILLNSLQNNIKNITYFSIDDADINKISDLIKKDSIKPFVGTMQVHQVKVEDYTAGLLTFFRLSLFDVQSTSYFCGILDYSDEDNGYTQIEPEVSSDSDDDLPLSNLVCHKKKMQRIHYNGVYSDDEAGPSSKIYQHDLVPSNIIKDTYVLVEYKTKLTGYRYAAVVQNVLDDDEVLVMFLKVCKFQNMQAFRANDNDTSFVGYDQIIAILPPPNIFVKGNKTYYKFHNDVDVFECIPVNT